MPAILSTLAGCLTPLSLLSVSLPSLIVSEAVAFYPGSACFKLASSAAFVWRSFSPAVPNTAASWISASLVCGLLGDYCLIPSWKAYHSPKGGHEGDSVWFKVGMLAFMLNHAGYLVAFLQDLHSMNWQLFGVVLLTCIVMGDPAGMPVPWRKDHTPSPSPRLPTITTTLKNADVPSSPLDRSASPSSRPRTSDSGVTDLSISIPTTPKSSSSSSSPTTTTASTPLLPQQKSSLIPKLVIPADMKPLILVYQLIITTMVASAAGTRGIGSARLLGAAMFMISDVIVAWDTFGVKPAPQEAAPAAKKSCGRDGWLLRGVGWVLYFGGQYLLAAKGAR
ncbi:hypothetical protein TWF696_003447 [Orbilia brochopaga]|uniref:Uncharacterized protein n=1 Tax=Orbilia brochopaga TaxID=3140254 RepID=A0AAV9TZI6_9PEZI